LILLNQLLFLLNQLFDPAKPVIDPAKPVSQILYGYGGSWFTDGWDSSDKKLGDQFEASMEDCAKSCYDNKDCLTATTFYTSSIFPKRPCQLFKKPIDYTNVRTVSNGLANGASWQGSVMTKLDYDKPAPKFTYSIM
jgi:hypothetical protein